MRQSGGEVRDSDATIGATAEKIEGERKKAYASRIWPQRTASL
jgi:hypothetical protein